MPAHRPLTLALILTLAAAAVFAQGKPPAAPAAPPAAAPGAPPAAPPNNNPPPPRYDKTTETRLQGPILEVRLVATASGIQGTHVVLKQGTQDVEVFLGPTPLLTRSGLTLEKGEMIEVMGSKVDYAGAPALLAREIKKGEKTFTLRDENGRPVWARGGS
jgi:hypothetical protein